MQKEQINLPPKIASIEQLVTVPADIKKVIAGKKTATRRNGRYADVGEEMELEGQKFIITSLYRAQLKDMTDEDAVREGYANLEDYQSFILAMHPGMKWLPEMKVWVHEYKAINKINE